MSSPKCCPPLTPGERPRPQEQRQAACGTQRLADALDAERPERAITATAVRSLGPGAAAMQGKSQCLQGEASEPGDRMLLHDSHPGCLPTFSHRDPSTLALTLGEHLPMFRRGTAIGRVWTKREPHGP